MVPSIADRLIGAYPVLPTPFHDDQSLDLEGLGEIVDRLLSHGVRGLTVLASGAEGPYLTDDERYAIVRHVAERARGRATVLVGLLQFATAVAVEQGKRFRDLGADAVLVGMPQPYDTPFTQVIQHYTAVVRDVELPTLHYHASRPTHPALSAKQVGTLFAEVSLVGIENASAEAEDLRAQIRAVGRPISMFTGRSADCLACLEEGGVGAICPVAALMPKSLIQLVDAYRMGADAAARAAQARLRGATSIVTAELFDEDPVVVPHWGVKEALVAAGILRSATVRHPQTGLSGAQRAKIRALAPELVEL